MERGVPMPTEIAGTRIPDSRLALEVMELAREASTPALFRHVLRTYLFAELVGRHMEMRYEPELLYIAAVLHDFGLTD
jgi:HD-GYP domain-containing protein (c-di-GMP phosphodiesterase class II)